MNKNKFLQPSGMNNQFYGEGLAFQDYIVLMRDIIQASRFDLNQANLPTIIEANSPFAYEPIETNHQNHYENGILLIHGLFDSPFFLTDIAKHFSASNFLVYSVLLPGHGTIPGDLLNIEYSEWIKAINYGIKCLSQRVKNLFIAGFSLGGTLALYQALTQATCKALLLFAPALKTKTFFRYMIARYSKLFSWTFDKAKWFQIRPQTNFAKYNSYAFNAGYQACLLMDETYSLLQQTQLDVPLFIVSSEDDETVSDMAIFNFFQKQKHSDNKMIFYSSSPQVFADKRIITRKSYFPEKNILDFSHICLPISPQNIHIGEHSHYSDFSHYKKEFCHTDVKDIYSGAITKKNLKTFFLRRLAYNPDFENMVSLIDKFFKQMM